MLFNRKKQEKPTIRAQVELPGTGLDHIIWMEDEEILKITSDHWTSFVTHMFIPAVIMFFSLLIVVLRTMGVQFFVTSGVPASSLDLTNAVLGALAAMLVVGAFLVPRPPQDSNNQQRRAPLRTLLMLLAIVPVGLVAYRFFLGGRLVAFDDGVVLSLNTVFDPLNLFFMGVAALMIPLIWLIYIECENDHLILTNRRVILSDRTIAGRFSFDEISIESIQDVSVRSDTYLAYWLRYGHIQVQSASQSKRGPLMFPNAEYPEEMQKAIMKQVNAKRGEISERTFRDMVTEKVYNHNVAKPHPTLKVEAHSTPPLLRRLVQQNPEISEDGTIIWRRHWYFMVLALLRPIGFVLLAYAALFLVNQAGLLSTMLLWVGILSLALFFALWAAYEIEDYRNDKYILSETNVTDIEQKPWGPSNRRNASLGAIQNVNSNTTLWSRMLGYGDVLLETAGASGQFTFRSIPEPDKVVATINSYRDEFKRGEKARALDDTLRLMRHYHESSDVIARGRMEEMRHEIQQLTHEINSMRDQMHRIPSGDVTVPEDRYLSVEVLADTPPPADEPAPTAADTLDVLDEFDGASTSSTLPSYAAEHAPLPSYQDTDNPAPPPATTRSPLPVYEPNASPTAYTVRNAGVPDDPELLARLLTRSSNQPAAPPAPAAAALPRYGDPPHAGNGTDSGGTPA